MADNLSLRDAANVTRTIRATDESGVHTTHSIIHPTTSGGLTIYRNIDLDETGVNIKASAGQIYGIHVFNGSAGVRYLKLYNKATAPTVGADTPVLTIPVGIGLARDIVIDTGIAFSLGIGAGAVTGVADNSTGAPGTNDVILDLLYK